jgi:hypothetical protein
MVYKLLYNFSYLSTELTYLNLPCLLQSDLWPLILSPNSLLCVIFIWDSNLRVAWNAFSYQKKCSDDTNETHRENVSESSHQFFAFRNHSPAGHRHRCLWNREKNQFCNSYQGSISQHSTSAENFSGKFSFTTDNDVIYIHILHTCMQTKHCKIWRLEALEPSGTRTHDVKIRWQLR